MIGTDVRLVAAPTHQQYLPSRKSCDIDDLKFVQTGNALNISEISIILQYVLPVPLIT
jgi:hypothetical protein